MKDISLSIDGKHVGCSAGTSLLKAAEAGGIKIPRLCDHPDLKPVGACRLCLVEDKKTGRIMASCVTPAVQDMVILTDSERIKKHRRNIVRLMIAEHPESCLVCNKGNQCRLRQVAADLGIGATGLYKMPNAASFEQANPFITRDLSKCILCGKCIRADHELVVVGAIDYNHRGFKTRPATVHERPLENSSCTFCGTCVSMCPTGALSPNMPAQDRPFVGTPELETHSICGFCGVGCSLAMGVAGRRVVAVNPSGLPGTVNRSTLCVRGHFAHDFLNSPDRLTVPGITREGRRTPAQWDEALELIAGRLLEIRKARGPQSVAFWGSSKCTNEENYLFQKIARVYMGTSHVDNSGNFFGQSRVAQIHEQAGGKYRVNRLDALNKAKAILILGADPAHSTPVVGYYLKRAAEQGVPLIVVNPRHTELADHASIWLPVRPQTDLELINGLAALLCARKGYDRLFVEQHTSGFDTLRSSLSNLDLDRICRITQLDIGQLEKTAALLAEKKTAIIVGNGIVQQKYGRHTLQAVMNLSLMGGGPNVAGAGIYFLAGDNNQTGAMDMGTVPGLLPGRQPLAEPGVRRQWEQRWHAKLPSNPGLTVAGMIEAAQKGTLKALYIMGENPLRSLPQPGRVKAALEQLDFLVVQDILNTETARIADVVLPGAAFSEKKGSFTNLEGRIQSFSEVLSPPGGARPDWEILDQLAVKLGNHQPYGGLEKIRAEIREYVPMYKDLQDSGQGWITETCPGAGVAEAAGRLIPFSAVESTVDQQPDEDYPFTAILGTLRFHSGGGTRSTRSARMIRLGLPGEIEISPEDGLTLGLQNRGAVAVISKYGRIARKIRMEESVGRGQIYIPLAVNENDAMHLMGLSDLSAPESSGLKMCRVRLDKV
ncbi:MAG: molybdopterin-dependent oxidoreductase [Desulfobacterales bacterium]|nr:molybdopterin-dependent oxidoreductase [Desulfobacterales bacterium]